ncbi:MAG: LPS export ABC transporter periplasmic protein LptC [Pseudomonadota bacterium]
MDATVSTLRSDDALWAPRRQLTLAQARRRSQVVKTLRVVFTAAAAVCLGVLTGHLAANAIERSAAGRDSLRADEMVTMVNPRFTGRDSGGDVFVITADSAQRRRSNEDIVDLVNPKLVDSEGGEVIAPAGLYDRAAQTLELFEDVQVLDSAGYTFTSTHARVYVEEGRVEGIDPLDGTGPIGDVRADAYEILDDGNRVVVRGRVQTTLFPDGRSEEE